MKCPNCGYVTYQNNDECVKCGASLPPSDGVTSSDADFRRGVRRKAKPQLDFTFPPEPEADSGAKETTRIQTAIETKAALPGEATRTKVSTRGGPTEATRSDSERLADDSVWNRSEAGSKDGAQEEPSDFEPGTHWDEGEPSTASNTWVEVYRLASGFGRRMGAMITDALVFAVLLGILVYSLRHGGSSTPLLSLTVAPAYAFLLVLNAFYFTFFHAVIGQTPGKMLWGIRVVSVRDGLLLSPWDAFMRWLGYFFSALPLGLGFLWCVVDRDDRAWHDRWAHSVVVRVDSMNPEPEEA
jgi:uncharacterized RDD family membrane protein YckC